MDRIRIISALALSLVVLMAWPVAMHYFFPEPAVSPLPQDQVVSERAEQNGGAVQTVPQAQSTQGQSGRVQSRPSAAVESAQAQSTQAAPREITIDTPRWSARITNRGAVATSWIIKKIETGAGEREIRAADGGPLQLIPQEIIEQIGAPLRLYLPWSPDIASHLNQVNFQVEGVDANTQEIHLGPGEQRQIIFTYSSPTAVARKAFTFYGDQFTFDVTTDVTINGSEQPCAIVLGPRIGDQSERETGGSYSTPPQVIAYNRQGDREHVLGASITPVFGKVTAVDHEARRIDLDNPLAFDVDQVKLVGGDGHTFLGYSRVLDRDASGRALTLDRLPEGVAVGSGVAQGFDRLKHGYSWAGLVDHYFAMVALPTGPAPEILLTNVQMKVDPNHPPLDYPSVAVSVQAGAPTHMFMGPKDRELLATVGKRFGTDLEALIDYGMFSFMIRPLVPLIGWALDSLARLFHNYGWSIVVVTVIINLALSPLRWYSSKKMKAAAKHQPRMKELQDRMKKLKENPKKYERELTELQQQQMALMKEANPLGGCLPLLLQMPIFWAFFVYLTISLDVRQAPWILWLHDLSKSDPYYVLPIVMCVTMIASTKLTPQPASADPSMKMQRIMMTWLMPIMLTWFFFFSAPSGLVLYWMVSNVVGVVIQLVINKATAQPATADSPGSAGANGSTRAVGADAKAGKKGDTARKRKVSEKETVGGIK